MSRLLKRLHISNGDIIALKHQSENANKVAMDFLATALEGMKVDAIVVVVKDFDDMTVLNETEMNKRGWYKFSSISKVLKIPAKEPKDD